MKEIEKIWGREYLVTESEKYSGKILDLKEGHISSYHKHMEKEETILVLAGKVLLKLNNDEYILSENSVVHNIKPGDFHSFEGLTDSKMIEFSTPHTEDDIIRQTKSKKIEREIETEEKPEEKTLEEPLPEPKETEEPIPKPKETETEEIKEEPKVEEKKEIIEEKSEETEVGMETKEEIKEREEREVKDKENVEEVTKATNEVINNIGGEQDGNTANTGNKTEDDNKDK